MGIQSDFPKLVRVLPRGATKADPPAQMIKYAGWTGVVDAANLLQAARLRIAVARPQWQHPPQPAQVGLHGYLDTWYAKGEFAKLGIRLLFVVDTERAEIKEEISRESRSVSANAATALISAIRERGNAEDLGALERAYCVAGKIDADLIAALVSWAAAMPKGAVVVIGAPDQADATMVRIVKTLIPTERFIISLDSDMLPFGVPCDCPVLMGLDCSGKVPAVVQRGATLSAAINAMPLPQLRVLACFCGHDNLPHPRGWGFDRALMETKAYWALTTEQERSSFLVRIEASEQWPASSSLAPPPVVAAPPSPAGAGRRRRRKKRKKAAVVVQPGAPGYAARFRRALAYWSHAPVWHIKVGARGADAVWAALVAGEYVVVLVPLEPCTGGAWASGKMQRQLKLGTDAPAKPSPSKRAEWQSRAKLVKWRGSNVEPVPHPLGAGGVELPHGSVLDLAVCPLALVHRSIIGRWLLCHDVSLPLRLLTDEGVQRLYRKVVERAVPPLTQEDFRLRRMKHECHTPEATYNIESTTTDCDGIVAAIRSDSIETINDALVDRDFGKPRDAPVVRLRALHRFRDGNIIIQSAKLRHAKHEEHGKLLVLEIDVAASQRGKTHLVRAVFRKRDGRFMGSLSSCLCEVGSLFCAHLLAVLLLLYVVQTAHTKFAKVAVIDVIQMLPQSALKVQQASRFSERVFAHTLRVPLKPPPSSPRA